MSSTAPKSVRTAIRSQWLYGAGFLALGLGFLVVFAVLGRTRIYGLLGLLPVFCGLGLILISVSEFRSVSRRNYGIKVEQDATAQACKILPKYGFSVSPNVTFRGRGDIDLVVGHDRHQMPVEIKAYESWDATHAERCRSAIEQVARAQRFLHARRSYVWLPRAKVGFWRRWRGLREGEVTVVFGHARNLARVIHRQNKD